MTAHICTTCGTEYPPSDAPPLSCLICQDERQYINPKGQAWTDSEALLKTHHTVVKEKEPNLFGIGLEPSFAIGQRALFVRTPSGNVLWDCFSIVDAAARKQIDAWGGLKAIAISHPHFYSGMVSWSRAFGDTPIYLHEDDRKWAMRTDGNIVFWPGDIHTLAPGITLIRCGGHFAGGTVLHWVDGAGGKGALLSGDILQVAADNRHVGFMRSFPNYIPLSPHVVTRITDRIASYKYDRIYGGFWGRVILDDGMASVARSAARYITAVTGQGPADFEP